MKANKSTDNDNYRPRLLCLHGACSNSEITRMQIIGLNLHDAFDCVYLDAPHATRPAPGLENFTDGPYRAWSDPNKSLEEREDQWTSSMEYVIRRIGDDGPYDGVYGFSQGAALITNISHPSKWQPGGSSGRTRPPPWKFAILACGAGCHNIAVSRCGSNDDTTRGKIDIPSFHIFGKNDRHASESRAICDYWSFDTRVMHVHGRGHEIDIMMHVREVIMMNKLRSFLEEQRRRRSEGGGCASSVSRLRAALCGLQMPEFYLGGFTFGGKRRPTDADE